MKRRVLLCAALAATFPVGAKDAATADFEKFRDVLEADNPAELFEMKGEELWKTKRGPNKVSLEQCDLGLGTGVVKDSPLGTGLPRRRPLYRGQSSEGRVLRRNRRRDRDPGRAVGGWITAPKCTPVP